MLELRCDFCNNTLSEKGAVLIAPPSKNIHKIMDIDPDADVCRKFHICVTCYDKIMVDRAITREIREWKPR